LNPIQQELVLTALPSPDSFVPRHVGPSDADVRAMLADLGYPTLDSLIDATVPANIRLRRALDCLPGSRNKRHSPRSGS
jgi:glycine dehydrogenase